MKKYLLIFLFVIMSFAICESRSIKNNSIMLCFQPVDVGLGIRYNGKITDQMGAYTSLSYGNYRLSIDNYIVNHLKVVVGAMSYAKYDYKHDTQFHFGFGVVSDFYGDIKGEINYRALMPISLEMAVGMEFNNKWICGIRFNPYKAESSVDLGICF